MPRGCLVNFMHYLIVFAILFFATEPLKPTTTNAYLSVLSNGTVLTSIDGSLLNVELPSTVKQVVSGWVVALIYDDNNESQLRIEKICTPEANTHSFFMSHHNSPALEARASGTINIDTCTYNPPIRTTYYNESTTPWLQGKSLNTSVFRVAYSDQDQTKYGSECISEEEVRSYLYSISTSMRLLTNSKAFFNVQDSFISPVCIPSSYSDADTPNNDVIRFLNTQNTSLYDDSPPSNRASVPNLDSNSSTPTYEWLKKVPARASFRLFISSTFSNYDSYKLTLNATELFSYTAHYWNGGPWVYIPHTPSSVTVDINAISTTTELMRSFWFLAELGVAKITSLTSLLDNSKATATQLDPMEIMGSGEATEFSVPSLRWQIYQMGIVSPSFHVKIEQSRSSIATYQTYTLLASDCPYTRSFLPSSSTIAMTVEIVLDSSFISNLSRTVSFILEYRRSSSYSFGGLSIRVIAGDPQAPGSRFDAVAYSVQSEVDATQPLFLAMAQPIPGRAWRCPLCDLKSFSLVVDETIAPCYTSSLTEMLNSKVHTNISQLSYAAISYVYQPTVDSNQPSHGSSSSNNTTSELSFLPFELKISPGIVCTSSIPTIESTSVATINCSSYTYALNPVSFNIRPIFRRGGGALRYYTQDVAYSWPHYTFSYPSTSFSGGTNTDQSCLWFSVDPSTSTKLQVKLSGSTSAQKELPATLLVHYVCGWQTSSSEDTADIVDVYHSKHGQMANALLIFTDEGYKTIRSTVPHGYIAVRDMYWNIHTWIYYSKLKKATANTTASLSVDELLDSDSDLRRDYEFTYRVLRLPYTDTQCTFRYHAHGYTENESLSNYSNTYSYTRYKTKTKRIAITRLDYSSGSYTFTSASMPSPDSMDYNCTAAVFMPTLFLSKRWYALMDSYNADNDVEIYLDFHTDLPEYLVIFVSTIRDVASIDCRMLAVVQRSVRDEAGEMVMISYKLSLKDLIGDPSFKYKSNNATDGVSISFSDDVTLVNMRIVSVESRVAGSAQQGEPAVDKERDSNDTAGEPPKYILTIPSGTVLCTPKSANITTWTHENFNVIINGKQYTVSSSAVHTVNSGYTFYRGLYTVPYRYWDDNYDPGRESTNCPQKTYLWRGLNSSLSCIPCPDGSICRDNIRTSCGFGFFTSKNSESCDRVYPGNYTTMTEETAYQEPSYHVRHSLDGSGYLTTNCPPYLFMKDAFCKTCTPLGYLCIPGGQQIPCPRGFRCIRGEAIPCIDDEYQDNEGQSTCNKGVSTLVCNIKKNEVNTPCSIVEQEYTATLPLAIHNLVNDGPNVGCRACPAGHSCKSIKSTTTLSVQRCPLEEYSTVGLPQCKRCPPGDMQSAIGDVCIHIPLKVRDDANVNPDDDLCTPANCAHRCVNDVCVAPILPMWATVTIYVGASVLISVLITIFIILSFKYCRQCKIRRRRCNGL
ncbi:hypothetical protein QR46_3312 [Giardia duodenalis assemblage B]|uniref:Uncharacterized protein n=1 Tax=Giardia duodenalis assemblage B TaxID=1394984 RepID=A0A132NRT6_GIAIN|nr:hypothetical protein QR46_3312 [Giardia intestinalis assemblage B]